MLQGYLDYRYANNASMVTIRNHGYQLRGLLREIGLDDFTPRRVREYAEARGLLTSSVRGYMNVARVFSRWMVKAGHATVDPFAEITLPPRARANPKSFTPELRDSLIANAPAPLDEWLTLAAFAGFRAADIAHAHAADVQDGPDGLLLVIEESKGRKERVVPAVHARVAAVYEGRRGLLYPGVTPNHVSWRISVYFRRQGIPAGAIHRMRHTFGQLLYDATEDPFLVQEAMGHDSIASTRIYAHPKRARVAAAIDAL